MQNQQTTNAKQQNVRDCFVLAQRKNLTTEKWLQLRRGGISGTDASKIMGLNKFSSPLKLYLEKTGIISDHVETNAKMQFGIRMEAILRQWYAEDSGNEVIEVPAVLANKERPWMIADVDGIVYETDEFGNKIPGVLEIKTSSFGDELQDNGVNPIWYCQVMHYLATTGCSFGIIYALVNNELYTIRIERNEDVINALIAKEEEFYKVMQEKNMPAIQAFDNSIMQQVFPTSKPASIKLSDDYIALLEELEAIKTEQAAVEERRNLCEAKLKAALGENESAECGLFRVTWKTSSRSTFDSTVAKSILTDDQIAKCTKVTASRTLRISKAKATKKK